MTVATTPLIPVSITDTVPAGTWFVTYARVAAGCTAAASGWFPTATVATTAFVAVSTTVTVASPWLTT